MLFFRKSRESIVKHSLPAVVTILETSSEKKETQSLGTTIKPILFPFGESKITADVVVGSGSGFFVDPQGLVITSRHVFTNIRNTITVVTTDGAHLPATIISIDPIDDIAILKTHDGTHPYLALGNSSNIALGEEVLAIGNPLGLFQNSISRGIISGIGRAVTTQHNGSAPIQELRGLIQTDASINIGNSGGPLLNRKGHVIGVNTFVVAHSENLSFAVPINAVKRDLRDIQEYGAVRLPFLGLRYVIIDTTLAQTMHRSPNFTGALVTAHGPHHTAIIPKSPAEQAGFKENDIIVTCNKKRITQFYNIQDVLEEHRVGDVLRCEIYRGADKKTLSVTLTERPHHATH